jgi:hypothetical protein
MPDNQIVFAVGIEDASFIQKWIEGRSAVRAMGRDVDTLEKSFQRASLSARELKKWQDDLGKSSMYSLGAGGAGMFRGDASGPPAAYAQWMKQQAADATKEAVAFTVAAREGAGQMASLAAQFAGFGSSMAALYTVAGGIRAELEHFRALRQEAKGDISTYAKGLANVELQMGSEGNMQALEPQIRAILGKAGVPMGQVPQALEVLSQMMSSRGPMPSGRIVTPGETMGLFGEVAKLFARQGDWEGAQGVGAGLMDIFRAKEGQDPKEIVGTVVEAFGLSRTTTMKKFGMHTLTAMAQMMKEGRVDLPTAAGITGVMGFEEADPQARVAKTAALGEMVKLDELAGASRLFNPKQLMDFKKLDTYSQMKWISGEGQYKDAKERRRADMLRVFLGGTRLPDADDVEMAMHYAGTMGFTERGALHTEVRAEKGVISMLSKSDPLGMRKGAEEITRNMRGVSPEVARRRGEEFFAGKSGGPFATFRGAEMAAQGAETQLRLGQVDRAWQGLVLGHADALLDQVGRGTALGKRVGSFKATIGTMSRVDAVEQLKALNTEAMRASISAGQPLLEWNLRGFGKSPAENRDRRFREGMRDATPYQRQQIRALSDSNRQLDALLSRDGRTWQVPNNERRPHSASPDSVKSDENKPKWKAHAEHDGLAPRADNPKAAQVQSKAGEELIKAATALQGAAGAIAAALKGDGQDTHVFTGDDRERRALSVQLPLNALG